MNYDECREWLETRRLKLGSVPGLDEVNKLLDMMGRPDEKLKIIHIAGTNGKGSTGYLLEQIFVQNKIKVGRFLSPAVVDEREIILVNGKMVYKTVWAKILSNIIDVVEKKNIKTTAFEIELVLSLLIFFEKKCDVVILECGMGGLLDATNACHNDLVDIITSVSIDHRNFLGDTIKEISLHKFGIIKDENSKIVIAPQTKEVLSYFDEYIVNKSYVNRSDITVCEPLKDKPQFMLLNDKPYISFSYKSYVNLFLSLAGTYQTDNAVTVLETVDTLIDIGFDIKKEKVYDAFRNAVWLGRFEVFGNGPVYIIDGAHNFDAVERLMESVEKYFPGKRIVTIIGMYKDKDYSDVIKKHLGKAKAVLTVTAKDKKRAIDAFELGKVIKEFNSNVTASDSYEEALEMASYMADGNDIILVFGSLSFMGEMRELIKELLIKKAL